MICINGSMMLRKADWARHNHGTRNRGAFHIPYTCFQIHTPYSVARSQQFTTLPSSVCTIPCDGGPFPCLHKVQLPVTDHSRSMSRPFYQRYEGYEGYERAYPGASAFLHQCASITPFHIFTNNDAIKILNTPLFRFQLGRRPESLLRYWVKQLRFPWSMRMGSKGHRNLISITALLMHYVLLEYSATNSRGVLTEFSFSLCIQIRLR